MYVKIEDEKYSESFMEEVKKQLTQIFENEFAKHIKLSMLWLDLCAIKLDETGSPFYSYMSIYIPKANFGLFNRIEVHWQSEDGTVVFPTDDIKDKKISFSLKGMPTQEKIEAAIERNKYRWEPIKRENLFNKKEYRFKLRESATLINAFPDIYIRIKSVEKIERLNEVIGQTIAGFNVNSESKDNVNGLIHDFDSKKVKKDVYLFHVDTGSGAIEAIEGILKGLHASDLVIESISLE